MIVRLVFFLLLVSPVAAQQVDPAKLGSVLRQQRDMANDNVAACSVAVSDLQAKVADLEKQLAAAKQVPAETEAPK